MKKPLLTLFALFITTISLGQTLHTTYYKDSYLSREATEGNAKFVQTAVRNPDGSVTTEVKNIRKDEVISSETYKGKEPVGVWSYKNKNMPEELDYSFGLVYLDKPCADTIAGVQDYFKDNDSLKYVAPKISGSDQGAMQFISRNIFYPSEARESGIEGKVYLTLTISADGNIGSVVVKKGVAPLLDKEAVRVLRKLKFSSPPIHNGQPVDICITMPLRFEMM